MHCEYLYSIQSDVFRFYSEIALRVCVCVRVYIAKRDRLAAINTQHCEMEVIGSKKRVLIFE